MIEVRPLPLCGLGLSLGKRTCLRMEFVDVCFPFRKSGVSLL